MGVAILNKNIFRSVCIYRNESYQKLKNNLTFIGVKYHDKFTDWLISITVHTYCDR